MPARAKLPPGKGKRVPLNMRTTQEIRERLEQAAADSGRSLVQEVEARLERSFQEEDALGGRQLRSMFGLLANAAVLIEEQTGKSCFEDYHTWIAVHAAWKRLIVAFAPSWPEEMAVALKEAIAAPTPKFPMPPAIPLGLQSFFGQGSEDEARQYQKQVKEYEAARKRYKKEFIKYEKAGEDNRRFTEEVGAQADWGKGIGISLLPEKPKKES
jgi:hypothetical protein